MALDSLGNLFITEFGNNYIRKLSPNGTVTTWWLWRVSKMESLDKPPLKSVLLRWTQTALYLTDTTNHTIRKIFDGQVSTFAGTRGVFGDEDENNSKFYFPRGVCDPNDTSLPI